MNLNILHDFRHEVYGCFERAADALFNTVDALLTETQTHSFVELSLSPLLERRWCSLYEAFEDGRIDQERLRRVFAKYLLQPVEGKQMWLGIDTTSIERPESKTSPDRTVEHHLFLGIVSYFEAHPHIWGTVLACCQKQRVD